MEPQEYNIVPTQSSVDWVGRQVTRSHYGTISVKSGSLTFLNDDFIAGEIVIDVASLKVLDITDPAANYQFLTHLNSRDFFATDEYPEAFLEITHLNRLKGDEYEAHADLTIRGLTSPVTFQLRISVNGDKVNAITKLTVDRTVYGMRFRSRNFFKDLGDNLIYNDFDLSINITASISKDLAGNR